MKRKWKLAAFAALVAAAGIYLAFLRQDYRVVTPRKEEIQEAVYGLGRVKSNKRFEVILGVISTVTRLYADEGTKAPKGAPLVAFDANVAFRAPFAGTVTFVRAREGETALPNLAQLRLEDLSDRFIELSLEQQAALKVKEGQSAKVSFESLRGEPLTGKVSALFSRENEFLAHIRVDGLPNSVLPGMTADVTVEVGKVPGVLLVPAEALENGLLTVRRNGRWRKEKVATGHVGNGMVEIMGDTLSETDEIRIRED